MVGTAGEFARRQDIPVTGITMTLGREDFKHPTRVGRIHVEVSIAGDLTAEELERVARVAERCKVHQTLEAKDEPEITVAVVAAT